MASRGPASRASLRGQNRPSPGGRGRSGHRRPGLPSRSRPEATPRASVPPSVTSLAPGGGKALRGARGGCSPQRAWAWFLQSSGGCSIQGSRARSSQALILSGAAPFRVPGNSSLSASRTAPPSAPGDASLRGSGAEPGGTCLHTALPRTAHSAGVLPPPLLRGRERWAEGHPRLPSPRFQLASSGRSAIASLRPRNRQ